MPEKIDFEVNFPSRKIQKESRKMSTLTDCPPHSYVYFVVWIIVLYTIRQQGVFRGLKSSQVILKEVVNQK